MRPPSTTRDPDRHPPQRRVARRTAAVAVLAACAAALTGGATALAAPTGPPPVTILTSTPAANNANGDIFLTLNGATGTYLNGPTILDSKGNVIWFHPITSGQATDFRTQTYNGQPVLTWSQGAVGTAGPGQTGTDYIYNDRYQQIATVTAGNGATVDSHEFLITPQNTALITANLTSHADLTSIGGPANQTVSDGVVQEIDIATGKVLFQWDSDGSVPFSDSHQPLPASASTPWDWFHINAVKVDTDGNLLVNSRHTWTTYKINRTTGQIIWEVGGKHSTFTEQAAPGQVLDSAGEIFAWEHDPDPIGNGEYTWFDNDSAGTPLLPYSRAVTVKVDTTNNTATLLSSDPNPHGSSASSQGDVETTANGDLLVGWGNLAEFTEFDPSGNVVLDASYPTGVNSYRAYRLPWKAAPTVTASATTPSGGSITYSTTVTQPGGNLVPGGTVTFTDGATTLCTTPALVAGAGSCTATAPADPATITATYSGDANFYGGVDSFAEPSGSAAVGASVAGTLGLSVATAAPNLGAFTPGVAQTYTTTLTSTVTSTAQGATLSAVDASSVFTGHLVNTAASGGPYEVAAPLQVQAADADGATSSGAQALSSSPTTPVTLLTFTQPVSSDGVTIGFSQAVGAADPLRTGIYTKTITFTLGTTTP